MPKSKGDIFDQAAAQQRPWTKYQKESEAPQRAQQEWDEKGNPIQKPPKDLEKYAVKTPSKTRTVQIPASAIYCLRPDRKGSKWDAQTITFPREATAEDILGAFKSDMLIPRPTFSLRAAIRSRLFSPIEGGLLLLGLLGWMLFVWQAFRRKPETATQSA
jgi:hypothetical protein